MLHGIDADSGTHGGSRSLDGYDLEQAYEINGPEDLTRKLDLPDDSHDAIISCGTFTHGHVGPECFPELLRISRPGGVFACGTIGPVLDGAGFGTALARMVALGQITPVAWGDIPIYEGAEHPHRNDRGLVMVFRKL